MDLLEQYLEKWALRDPQPLTETVTSFLYTVQFGNERAVLKILKPVGMEERLGAAALRHFNGHGAVRLLYADDGAHLLEYAEGEDLIGMVQQGDDDKATEIIADVLNKLHSAPRTNLPPELVTLKRWFRALMVGAEKDRADGLNTIYMRAAPLAERLLNDPQDVCVLHGDMHHGNIRWHTGRGWLAFDPKGVMGERTYDVANVLCNPIETPELVTNEARFLRVVDILSEKMGIARSRILEYTFAYACLSARWIVDSNMDAEMTLKVAQIAERHLPA